MGQDGQSWKTLFLITEQLEQAALRKEAQMNSKLYGNLTFSQSRVCIALIRMLEKMPEGVTLKQLSAELEITPGATSELVEELVKKGIVSRTQSKNDRRAVCIKFLDNIMAMHKAASREIDCTYRKMLTVLTEQERLEWARISEKIITGCQTEKGQF